MGGQILGGGAIALVIAVLWLVYLLPTWQTKMRYNAAERNAVRLNQALRVLAESSETPGEVRVELSRREAAKQHRLVRRLEAEDDRLREEYDRAEVERRRREVEAKLERTRSDAEAERLERAIASEERRARLAALRADPRVRQAQARRRARLVATSLAFIGLAAVGLGAWQLAATGQWAWLAVGGAALVAGLATLRRMASVASRAQRPVAEAAPVQAEPTRSQSQIIDPADRGWTPRRLPAPLTATAGSRAASQVAAASARDRLQQAAREEAARARLVARQQPAPIPSRAADDAEIEQHVRELLARRAAS
ncbi:large exoprotein [Microbacterium karelineae]|uniref:large exoprotein n=1 Tax=Microbacterium karelineae TaxID=2654283 RepID=UPI0012E9BBB3|nr:large exoprotein [Microbacterium karelineae]